MPTSQNSSPRHPGGAAHLTLPLATGTQATAASAQLSSPTVPADQIATNATATRPGRAPMFRPRHSLCLLQSARGEERTHPRVERRHGVSATSRVETSASLVRNRWETWSTYLANVDVALVRWPEESARRDDLARAGRPRLLLVGADAVPPQVVDPLEDWVRFPGPEIDMRVRLDALAMRARLQATIEPTLDDDGVLRHDGMWVSLPPLGARMARLLLERAGSVVTRESLGRAAWPDGPPGRYALSVNLVRLRRRLAQVGLDIRTVRGRGLVLEASHSDDVRGA